MKMTDLLRIIKKMRLINLVILLLFASSYVEAIERDERDVLAARREYNDVSAAVDSLVRMMQVADAEVLNKLPEARARARVARGDDGCDDFLGG